VRVDTIEVLSRHGLPLLPIEESAAAPTDKVALAPTDIARIVTVDEGRASIGLPAWPEAAAGKLAINEFAQEQRDEGIVAPEEEAAVAPTGAPAPAPVENKAPEVPAQLTALSDNFDPNQPRDGEGQWSDTGGGESGGKVSYAEVDKLPDAPKFARPNTSDSEYRKRVYASKQMLEAHLDKRAHEGVAKFVENDFTLMRAAHTSSYEDYAKIATKLGKDSSEAAYKSKRASVDAVISGLQSLPDARADADITHVFRGLSVSRAEADSMLQSDSYNFDTLTSTSVDPYVAERYTTQHSSGDRRIPVTLRIKRKSKSNSAHVEGISMGTTEREVLFGPAKFNVTGRSKNRGGGFTLDLEET
jgi:hypothetical protein